MKYTTIPEQTWRKAEQNMARRERFRLVRLGRIVPVFRSTPQLMVREESTDGATLGRWCPELRIHDA